MHTFGETIKIDPHKIQSTKPVKEKMQQTPESITPMQDKIEKLKLLISENNKSGQTLSENQYNKKEKLQQKLRYLQFYDSYQVRACPESWRCTNCKEVQVTRKVVTYPGCQMEGKCKHRISHKKETFEKVSEWLCEDCESHAKEWENEEKCKVDVRMEIRRKFAAMVTKEKEVKSKKNGKQREEKVTMAEEFKVAPKMSPVYQTQSKEKQTESKSIVKDENFLPKNFHSKDCKTCLRMETLMGQILPHPVNVS